MFVCGGGVRMRYCEVQVHWGMGAGGQCAGVPETAGKSSQFGAAPRTSSAARLNYKSVLLHLASRNVFAGGFGLHS